jgi:hypothetical protein
VDVSSSWGAPAPMGATPHFYSSGVAIGCGTTRGSGFSSGVGGSSKLGRSGLGSFGAGPVGWGSTTGIGGNGVTDDARAENGFVADMPSVEATTVPSSVAPDASPAL